MRRGEAKRREASQTERRIILVWRLRGLWLRGRVIPAEDGKYWIDCPPPPPSTPSYLWTCQYWSWPESARTRWQRGWRRRDRTKEILVPLFSLQTMSCVTTHLPDQTYHLPCSAIIAKNEIFLISTFSTSLTEFLFFMVWVSLWQPAGLFTRLCLYWIFQKFSLSVLESWREQIPCREMQATSISEVKLPGIEKEWQASQWWRLPLRGWRCTCWWLSSSSWRWWCISRGCFPSLLQRRSSHTKRWRIFSRCLGKHIEGFRHYFIKPFIDGFEFSSNFSLSPKIICSSFLF